MALFLVVAGFVVGTAAAARAAGSEAEARKHARKANHLADINKCWSAITEYNLALKTLKDATLLFNRGECYRKTNQPEKAIADYKQFLVELPAAPNRAQVETQIAALEKVREKPGAAAPVKPAVAAAGPPAPVTVAPGSSLRLPPKAAHPLPPASDTSADKGKPKAGEGLAELDPWAPDDQKPLPPAAPAPAPEPLAMADTPQSGLLDHGTVGRPVGADTEQKPGHAWLWVLLGVVVVGGATAGYLVFGRDQTDTSGGALGNYKF